MLPISIIIYLYISPIRPCGFFYILTIDHIGLTLSRIHKFLYLSPVEENAGLECILCQCDWFEQRRVNESFMKLQYIIMGTYDWTYMRDTFGDLYEHSSVISRSGLSDFLIKLRVGGCFTIQKYGSWPVLCRSNGIYKVELVSDEYF